MAEKGSYDELWRRMLTTRVREVHAERWLLGLLPSEPRCLWCKTPFEGVGGTVMRRVFRRHRSIYNPRVCSFCEDYFRSHPGGAEVELSLLFTDVRGSTALAERMSATEFGGVMDRFYTVATEAICDANGLIEKFVGDEVASLFVPGFTGPVHAVKAIEAARATLAATGHGGDEEPWLPVGAGVHTGVAYVGSVGSGGVAQLTVLGDLANATARLASMAGAGEILVSEAAAGAAQLEIGGLEHRELELKGRSDRLGVYVVGA